ncbi:MAG: 4Fe-4S dicluster domain-containing protein [Candidatus Brocadiae bacterium]|nr:4Fe-4S dicluster domain-containing protein [Candidatus Brocadiia bacterium]
MNRTQRGSYMAEATTVDKQLVVDTARCIGCMSCAAACFYGHLEFPGLRYEEAGASTAMPAVCRQCEEAPCVEACPADAMYVDEAGIVRRSPVRCTGCRSCALACPFGVIDMETIRSEVAKCDLCADRTPRGLMPRCVAVCPSGALKFLEIAEGVPAAGYTLLSGRTLHRTR